MKMGKCRGMLVGDVKISTTLTLWVSHDPRERSCSVGKNIWERRSQILTIQTPAAGSNDTLT